MARKGSLGFATSDLDRKGSGEAGPASRGPDREE